MAGGAVSWAHKADANTKNRADRSKKKAENIFDIEVPEIEVLEITETQGLRQAAKDGLPHAYKTFHVPSVARSKLLLLAEHTVGSGRNVDAEGLSGRRGQLGRYVQNR